MLWWCVPLNNSLQYLPPFILNQNTPKISTRRYDTSKHLTREWYFCLSLSYYIFHISRVSPSTLKFSKFSLYKFEMHYYNQEKIFRVSVEFVLNLSGKIANPNWIKSQSKTREWSRKFAPIFPFPCLTPTLRTFSSDALLFEDKMQRHDENTNLKKYMSHQYRQHHMWLLAPIN